MLKSYLNEGYFILFARRSQMSELLEVIDFFDVGSIAYFL